MLSRRQEFITGINRTLPLLLGAFPFGLIYGALAISSGLSIPAVMGMSAIVFAGSAQFIAISLYATQTPIVIMIIVTFVVNLRHMLYSLSLLPSLKKLSQFWRIPLAFWLTDETYAVTAVHYQDLNELGNKHWFQLGSSIAMYLNWQFWSFMGMILGEQIPDVESWGLDIAMPITFIGMVIPLIQSMSILISVLFAGAMALLTTGLPYKIGLILSTILGILAGMLVDRIGKLVKEQSANV